MGKRVGFIIGAILLIAAVFSAFFIDWSKEPEEKPIPVRPLKTFVVRAPLIPKGRNYPGKVQATEAVDLAFQVGGPLIEFPMIKGQKVVKGELLARIDPRDFENRLNAAAAEVKRAQAHLDRNMRSVKTGAVSQADLDNAQASYDQAEANKSIAEKALEDTYLYAKFDGVIANTFVENYQNVMAKELILSLQDISSVEIAVAVPEERVIVAQRGDRDKFRFVATFETLPNRSFDMEMKEFTVEADPLTQTYEVTFTMPAPEDLSIFPGMTASVMEFPIAEAHSRDAAHAVPLDLLPVDGTGTYHAWKLVDQGDGTYKVQRTAVKVGEIVLDYVFVLEGLVEGDRIAAAGVHLLQEGQRVRLLEEEEGDA